MEQVHTIKWSHLKNVDKIFFRVSIICSTIINKYHVTDEMTERHNSGANSPSSGVYAQFIVAPPRAFHSFSSRR
jgi:hypothetical protein